MLDQDQAAQPTNHAVIQAVQVEAAEAQLIVHQVQVEAAEARLIVLQVQVEAAEARSIVLQVQADLAALVLEVAVALQEVVATQAEHQEVEDNK